MKKYRLSTTVSPKHWALLKKYTGEFETQQKALEQALEYMDNLPPELRKLSLEDITWLRVGRDLRSIAVLFPKDYFKVLIEKVDLEDYRRFVDLQKPVEFGIEYYHQKTLKACSLREVVDGIVMNIKIQSSSDMVTCSETDSYYEIYLTHTLGINSSIMVEMMNVSALKTYGARFDSAISERTVYFKIYKNNGPGKGDGPE
jgi:hypothetical protein